MTIDSGANVTIENVTLTGGHAPNGAAGTPGTPDSGSGPGGTGGFGGDGQSGGGIWNGGSLTLLDAAVTKSVAGNGGAGGAGGSSAHGLGGAGGQGGRGGAGGGIYNTGALTLTGVTVSDNRAGNGGDGGVGGQPGDYGGAGGNGGCCGDGGGVANFGGSLKISDSTIAGNLAGAGGSGGNGGNALFTGGAAGNGGRGARGGGISSFDAATPILLENSTIGGNYAGKGGFGGSGGSATSGTGHGGNGGNGGDGGRGGGIRISGSSSTLSSLTVAYNQAGGGAAAGAGGFGLASDGANGANGSLGDTGGVFIESPPAATLEDSIVAPNSAPNCLGVGVAINGGHNLSFPDTTCPGSNGDPKLAPLQDNGGPTQTFALKAGSAAIDQVPASGAGCPQTDQRGVSRPHGAACDIGAFELAGPDITTGAATAITTSGATLNGSVSPNQSSANVHFEYGTTSSYGATTGNQQVGGVGARPVSAQLTGLTPHTTYHYRLLGTSSDGSQTGADRTFTTQGAPRLSHLSIAPKFFRTKKRKHHPHDKVGATISYTDSQASTAIFTVWRCTKIKRRRGCVRYSKVATFTHKGTSGRNRFHWNGRIRRRALKPGRYRVKLTAYTGRLTSNTLSARFRIVI
jgi:hypothetical protein